MKCPKCGGRILQIAEDYLCINCGKEIVSSDNIYVAAINSLTPQKVLRKVWF